MKKQTTYAILVAALASPVLFSAPAAAVQGDYYSCLTQDAVFISSGGVSNVENVSFEFYWGVDQVEISEGWILTEYETLFEYSYQDREAFSVHSVWGMINYDAPAGIMTVYVPRANEMYS